MSVLKCVNHPVRVAQFYRKGYLLCAFCRAASPAMSFVLNTSLREKLGDGLRSRSEALTEEDPCPAPSSSNKPPYGDCVPSDGILREPPRLIGDRDE